MIKSQYGISAKQGGHNMKINYCCLDASAFSLGFAASHDNTLILEKSENVLSDFVNPITPAVVNEPQTDEGKAFAEYIRKSGYVSDEGILDSPSLAPVAAEYALNMNFSILLGTKIISCEKENEKYHIQVYTNSGLQNIICDKIIRRPDAETSFKLLNCIVSGTDCKTLSKFEKFGGRIKKSFEKDEFIVSMPFTPGCQFNEARIEFVKAFTECFGVSVQIDAFASDFEYGGSGGIIEEFESGVGYDLL